MWALRYTRLIYGFLGRGDICVSTGSLDALVYVAMAETPVTLVRHAFSVTQLENHTGGTSVSLPSTWSAKRQQDYAKSCHFISVSLSRNVLFSYGPEYGFFSMAVTSGFWVV